MNTRSVRIWSPWIRKYVARRIIVRFKSIYTETLKYIINVRLVTMSNIRSQYNPTLMRSYSFGSKEVHDLSHYRHRRGFRSNWLIYAPHTGSIKCNSEVIRKVTPFNPRVFACAYRVGGFAHRRICIKTFSWVSITLLFPRATKRSPSILEEGEMAYSVYQVAPLPTSHKYMYFPHEALHYPE